MEKVNTLKTTTLKHLRDQGYISEGEYADEFTCLQDKLEIGLKRKYEE